MNGLVALVTGASRGIGASLAVKLAAAGCDVACAARSTAATPGALPGTIDDTVAVVQDTGRRGLALAVDLRDADQARRMVDDTVEAFGRIDILVNNAAVWPPGSASSLSLKHFDLAIAINSRSPFVASQAAAAHMIPAGGGRILNVSSAAALYPVEGMVSYGMGKIALELLTLYLAAELESESVAVNCLRVDIPCRSAGYEKNLGELRAENFEPVDTAADALIWVLEQPLTYTGHRLGLRALRDLGTVTSGAPRPADHPRFPTNMVEDLGTTVDLSSVGR
jgi:NAD(P)-dependent dehydrogenase (short-subunit alcohol dehydrogenase family)